MKKNKGFTLVEVLICVGIIGIIAAITIPALLSSTSEKALEAQRKALHSRMAQAFAQIKNLKLYEQSTENEDGTTYNDTYSAQNFVIQALSKVYKLSDICDATSIRECGVPDEILDYYSDTASADKFDIINRTYFGNEGAAGSASSSAYNEQISKTDLSGLNAKYAAFKTANGESVLLYYNPKCKSKKESEHNPAYSVCVNMVYDLNGRYGQPNVYGEDIGVITVFYPTDPTVVMPILQNTEIYSAASFEDMLSIAAEKQLVPPTIEELVSILINKNLTHITKSLTASNSYWSASYSTDDTNKAWVAGFGENGVKTVSISDKAYQYFLIKK